MSTFLSYSIVLTSYLILIITLAIKRRVNSVSIAYFIFIFSLFIWTATLYIYFFVDTGNMLLFFGRLNYAAGFPLFFSLAAFFYVFPKKYFSFPKNTEYALVVLTGLLFFLTIFTPIIDADEIMTDSGPQVKFGPLYPIFMIYIIISLMLAIFFGFQKLDKLSGIGKKKFIYSFSVFIPTSVFLIIFNGILPSMGKYFFQNYSFVIMAPVAFASFYAILKYRFLDMKVSLFKLSKIILSFFCAFLSYYLINKCLILIFFDSHKIYIESISLFIGISIYNKVLIFLANSYPYYQFFGPNNVEYFKNKITNFGNKKMIYRTLPSFEKEIKNLFCKELGIDTAKIVVLNNKNQDKYKNLINFYKKSEEPLISKEIAFKEIQEGEKFYFSKELMSLGEVIMPLRHPSNKLIGFFILGKKQSDDVYNKEEISIINDTKPYISLVITGILYNKELQDEVKNKTAKLKKITELQSDFILSSTHELRTPCNILLLHMNILKNHFSKNDKHKKDFETAYSSLKRLIKLIHILLDVQAYERGTINPNLENINVANFLNQVYMDSVQIAKDKKIKIKLENNLKKGRTIKVDKIKILQVMHNLITNAIKFIPKNINGNIKIVINEKKNNVEISIIDNGIGVPKEAEKEIFKKFRTNNALKGGGFGLGLYLCKKIIESHNGKIWHQENPNGGSIFRFILPK
ncbi:MAG: ATP-binding protein [Candidatus Gracilibacteria bacterium]|jgi:hypothetical protein|nr:ATP-binding protein [Candidatus Gracilibacteria bacterium]